MFIVFTLLSVFVATLVGTIFWNINKFYAFLNLFINIIWGAALGTLISKNEFVVFSMPLLTLFLTHKVSKKFFPRFWDIISNKNNY